MATYIKKSTLSFLDLWKQSFLEKDKAGRWVISDYAPVYIVLYLSEYRTPSRAFPRSYASALLTQKFAKYLCSVDPELAVKLGVAEVSV